MSVYCNDCEHHGFLRKRFRIIHEVCNHPKNKRHLITYKGPSFVRQYLCIEANSKGQCQWYKRKWWKFWVKEGKS